MNYMLRRVNAINSTHDWKSISAKCTSYNVHSSPATFKCDKCGFEIDFIVDSFEKVTHLEFFDDRNHEQTNMSCDEVIMLESLE